MKKLFLSPVHVVAAFLSLACTHNLSASVVIEETFNYSTGSISGENGGTGWGGAWSVAGSGTKDVTSGSFATPTNYSYSTGSTYLAISPVAGSTTAAVYRTPGGPSLNLNPPSSLTLYYSVLFSRYDSAAGGSEWTSLLSMRNGSDELVRFGTNSGEGLTIDALPPSGVTKNVSTGNGYYSVGTNFGNAPQYLAVMKMVLNPSGTDDEFYYSIFPTSGSVPTTEPGFWALSMTADTSGAVDRLDILAGNGVGTLNVDNMYIGTTYASVIPEPATGLLLGAALAGFFGYRRRFKK
ncbi:MAG: PEP-CTERM sorting domain-containing protein [Chthoniobacterales bacterium]